jgi:integrase
MAKRNLIPSYRFHRRTQRAIVTVRNPDGSRRDVLLPGDFNSPESRQEYERILALLRANSGCLPTLVGSQADITVNELVLRFMNEHIFTYYIEPIGMTPTTEQDAFRGALRPLTRLFGSLPAGEFGPLNLRTVREAMITGTWLNEEERSRYTKANRQIGLARSTINKHVSRIRMMFRWATEMQILPARVLHALQAVKGLRKGRSAARETTPVAPVSPEVVYATLPHLPPVICDMVQLQLYTGARGGEICSMRAIDIDTTGEIWLFRPEQHKTQWMGHQRTIAIGPRGQEIVKKYFKTKVDAYLFSPAEQDALIKATLRKKRKSKVQPSQACRKKATPKLRPGEKFMVPAYNRAIARACEKAGIPAWHTHQLRHTAALLIEREFGLDAARAALGHRTANITAMYSGIDVQKAARVMAAIG